MRMLSNRRKTLFINKTIKPMSTPHTDIPFLVFNREEWLTQGMFTEDELNMADNYGFIAKKDGVNCYLARPAPMITTSQRDKIFAKVEENQKNMKNGIVYSQPHTDQFEEIVKEYYEWSYTHTTVGTAEDEAIVAFWLSKLHHLRRETEKGMMEKVLKMAEEERRGSEENMEFQRDVTKNKTNTNFWEGSVFGIKAVIERLESDNSTQK